MVEINSEILKENKLLGETLIYLVGCAVNEKIPEKVRLEAVDLEALYCLAKRHSLLAVCCMALEDADAFFECDKELVKKWMEGKNKAIRKNIILDAERKKICEYMKKNGIWYMPLKGIILKEYYPKIGMRQMADNDILYDALYQNQLMNYMESQGYKTEYVGKGNHDVYLKKPVFNFEMHTALYGKGHKDGWELYYRDVKKRLIQDPKSDFEYHFSEEDLYIYMISHTYKHFSGSGTGLRSLVDIYIFLKQMDDKINWHYVEKELDVLQLTEFEKETRLLCQKLFFIKSMELTSDETKLVVCYLTSGTYGTMKKGITKSLRQVQPGEDSITNATKRRYYFKRLIPDRDYYKKNFPILYKYKWMIPGFVIYRIIRAIFVNGKRIMREVQMVQKIKN